MHAALLPNADETAFRALRSLRLTLKYCSKGQQGSSGDNVFVPSQSTRSRLSTQKVYNVNFSV